MKKNYTTFLNQFANFIFVALIIFVFFIVACDKKNGLLNNANQNFDRLQVKTLNFTTQNNELPLKLLDNSTFYTDSSGLVLLGNYQDPVLGEIKHRFYTSLQLKSLLSFEVGSFIVDSVNIYLTYTSDTLAYGVDQNSAELTPEIYILNESLKSREELRYTYTSSIEKQDDISQVKNPNPLDLKPKDNVDFIYNRDTTTLSPTLVIPIKEELGQQIFDKGAELQNAESVLTQEILLEMFSGFVFETSTANSGVVAFNLQNTATVVRIFYHYRDDENKLGYYDLGLYFNNSNYFTQIDREKAEDLQDIYAFQGAGLGLEVDLSIIKKTMELEKKAVNQAVLYFYPKNEVKDQSPILPVSWLYPFAPNPSSDTPEFLPMPFPSFLNFTPIYNAEQNRYELYLTAYIQNLLSGSATDEKLSFFSRILTPNRAIIDENQTVLSILYTDFQKE